MVDSINVSDSLKIRKTEEPVEGQQTGYVSYRKNDYERTPNADTISFQGNEDNKKSNTGKIIAIGTAILAIGSAIYAGFHGKNILEKVNPEEKKGIIDKLKTGYKNFFTGKEKAAEKLRNAADNKKPPVLANPETKMPKAENPEEITNEFKEYSMEELRANCKAENGVLKLNNGELFNGRICRVNNNGEEIISEFKDGKITKMTKDFTQDKTSIEKMVTEYGENGEKQKKYLDKEGKEVNFFEELAKTDGEHILRNGTKLEIQGGHVTSIRTKSGEKIYSMEGGWCEYFCNPESHIGVEARFGEDIIARVEEMKYVSGLDKYSAWGLIYTNKTIAELRQELIDKYIQDNSTKKAILDRIPQNISGQSIYMNGITIDNCCFGGKSLTITSNKSNIVADNKMIYQRQSHGGESFQLNNQDWYYHNITDGKDVFIGPKGKISKEEFIRQRNHSIASALTDEQMAALDIRTYSGELATRANSLPTNIEGNYILRSGDGRYNYIILNPEGKIVGKVEKYTPDGNFEFLEIYNEQGERIQRMAHIEENEYGDILYDHGHKESSMTLPFGDSTITDTIKALINDTKGILS